MPSFGTVMWVGVGLAAAYLFMRIGIAMLLGITRPLPPPPPAGEMRKVNLRYRCSLCGAEMKMTLATDEDPDPPRHCSEDMDLMAPLYE